jgi:hypothetical protein
MTSIVILRSSLKIIGRDSHCVILNCDHIALMVGLYNNVCIQLMFWKEKMGK